MAVGEAGESGRTKSSLRADLRGTAVIQGLFTVLGGLAADFGVLGTWVLYAVATYWAVALPMLVFRRSRLTKVDAFFVRWGFLILLGIYVVFGATIHEWVQQWR
jgi:hypothetical protein